MFYRIKFDGVVGSVLDAAGFHTTEQKMNAWPAGLTKHLSKEGKKKGQDAVTAAYLGFANFFAEADTLELDTRKHLVQTALTHAIERGHNELMPEITRILAQID